MKISVVLLISALLMSLGHAKKYRIKVGVLAPDGTSWAKNIKEMVKEVKKQTDGEVRFKVYYGGAQGDEPEVLKKIRVDQLQGGIFTGKTLGDISGDVRVMEIPFTFEANREKAWNILNKMTPTFNKGFEKGGFVNLGFFEIGLIYLASKKVFANMEDLKSLKIWSWTGDPIPEELIKSMDLVSVPLALPDVLSSLSSGIVEAAYSPPLGIIALQWNTKIKYILDYPLTYSVGAFLIKKESYFALPEKHRKTIEKISAKYFVKVKDANIKENNDSMEAMKAMGIKMIAFPKEDYVTVQKVRKDIVKNLKGKLFSNEVYEQFQKLVNEK